MGERGIDLRDIEGVSLPDVENEYGPTDLALYALAVGMGDGVDDPCSLRYLDPDHPDGIAPLPTYTMVAAMNALMEARRRDPERDFSRGYSVLQSAHELSVEAELPPASRLRHALSVAEVEDRGRNALVVTEVRSFLPSGRLVAINRLNTIIVDAGGFGRRSRRPAGMTIPGIPPEFDIQVETRRDQAILYRLTGDDMRVHVDPKVAAGAGFREPILQGLCTLGMAVQAVARAGCAGARALRSIRGVKAEFGAVVYPGQTLRINGWRAGKHALRFTAFVTEGEAAPILQRGAVRFT